MAGEAAQEDVHFHPVEPRRFRVTLTTNFQGSERTAHFTGRDGTVELDEDSRLVEDCRTRWEIRR